MNKKVMGRYKEYTLTKKVMTAPDGDVYLVNGGQGEGLCAKFLTNRSLQSEVEACLQGGGSGLLMDTPLDIAVYRKNFMGYIYQDFDAWNRAPEEGPKKKRKKQQLGTGTDTGGSYTPDPIYGGGSGSTSSVSGGSGLDSPLARWGILLGIAALFAILNVTVFHSIFLNVVDDGFSTDIAAACDVLGFSGMTAVIVGLVLTVLVCRKLSEADSPVFWAVGGGCFIVGILLTDVLMVVMIQVVMGVVSLLVAALPMIILVLILLAVVKSMFTRNK